VVEGSVRRDLLRPFRSPAQDRPQALPGAQRETGDDAAFGARLDRVGGVPSMGIARPTLRAAV
jgi:hypothetical protein